MLAGALLDADRLRRLWLFSLWTAAGRAAAEEELFEAQYVRSQTGIGAEVAASH